MSNAVRLWLREEHQDLRWKLALVAGMILVALPLSFLLAVIGASALVSFNVLTAAMSFLGGVWSGSRFAVMMRRRQLAQEPSPADATRPSQSPPAIVVPIPRLVWKAFGPRDDAQMRLPLVAPPRHRVSA
jgi:hypothetical protein